MRADTDKKLKISPLRVKQVREMASRRMSVFNIAAYLDLEEYEVRAALEVATAPPPPPPPPPTPPTKPARHEPGYLTKKRAETQAVVDEYLKRYPGTPAHSCPSPLRPGLRSQVVEVAERRRAYLLNELELCEKRLEKLRTQTYAIPATQEVYEVIADGASTTAEIITALQARCVWTHSRHFKRTLAALVRTKRVEQVEGRWRVVPAVK